MKRFSFASIALGLVMQAPAQAGDMVVKVECTVVYENETRTTELCTVERGDSTKKYWRDTFSSGGFRFTPVGN